MHRLAYSFGWDASEVVPPGSSLVEIDLLEQPDGTVVRLTHTGLPNTERCASHDEGWAHYLGRLAEVAAGATLARTPGTAVLAGNDCSPLNTGCRCGARLARSNCCSASIARTSVLS